VLQGPDKSDKLEQFSARASENRLHVRPAALHLPLSTTVTLRRRSLLHIFAHTCTPNVVVSRAFRNGVGESPGAHATDPQVKVQQSVAGPSNRSAPPMISQSTAIRPSPSVNHSLPTDPKHRRGCREADRSLACTCYNACVCEHFWIGCCKPRARVPLSFSSHVGPRRGARPILSQSNLMCMCTGLKKAFAPTRRCPGRRRTACFGFVRRRNMEIGRQTLGLGLGLGHLAYQIIGSGLECSG